MTSVRRERGEAVEAKFRGLLESAPDGVRPMTDHPATNGERPIAIVGWHFDLSWSYQRVPRTRTISPVGWAGGACGEGDGGMGDGSGGRIAGRIDLTSSDIRPGPVLHHHFMVAAFLINNHDLVTARYLL